MKTRLTLGAAALLVALFRVEAVAQGPDGTDISQAIPIVFGQTVTDIIDSNLKPKQVYSITLARGQKISATSTIVTSSDVVWALCLYPPNTRSVLGRGCPEPRLAVEGWSSSRALSYDYQVPSAGTYFVVVVTDRPGQSYKLQVVAQGTPVAVPNPPTAGCLTSRVDSITYSLQFIAVGLADEVVVGGQRACASCTVKAPLYPEIVNRLENALKAKVNVEACYDAPGNIFQIKLVQP